MGRLIDADATFKLLRSLGSRDYRREGGTIMDAMKMISHPEYTPTVDAVEVVHGEWYVIEDDYFDLVELKCSACGESFGFEDYEDCIPQNYHYCPNCGAKMDGDGNG